MLAKLSTFGLGALTHIQSLKETFSGSKELPAETADISSNSDMATGFWQLTSVSGGSLQMSIHTGLQCTSSSCDSATIDAQMENGIMFNANRVND